MIYVRKCPFILFIYFWILLNLQGLGTDEQILVEILSSRSTKVSFGPCHLEQKIVRKLNWTCIVTVHLRERTKQNCGILRTKHVLKRFSLQSRLFLTKTRRYIDRGRHLEKQRKRLRGRGGGSGEGRGGERRKRLPAKPMKLSNAP